MNAPRPLLALVSLLLIGGAASAFAFNPQPDPPGLGMFGITCSQTARLNVVNIGSGIPDGSTRGSDVFGSRTARLSFLDEAGNVLAQSTVRMMVGEAATLEFIIDGCRAEVGAVQRMNIRAAFDSFAEGPHVKNASIVLATVEVFDTESGQTAFVMPGTILFDPALAKTQSQTERFHWFGMTGLTRAQTARLNVVLVAVDPNNPNAPGSYTSGLWIETFFYDGDGRLLSRSAPRPLQVGIAYGHEMAACPTDPTMPTDGCAPTAVERTGIRATVRMYGDVNGDKAITSDEFRVVSNLEIYDGDGRTQTVALPAAQ